MTDETRQMYADGERRLRERRIAIQPDPMVAVLNLVTADRDRLKEELRRLKGGDANGHSGSVVPDCPWCGCR